VSIKTIEFDLIDEEIQLAEKCANVTGLTVEEIARAATLNKLREFEETGAMSFGPGLSNKKSKAAKEGVKLVIEIDERTASAIRCLAITRGVDAEALAAALLIDNTVQSVGRGCGVLP
jgi:hypothetical protein